MTKSIQLAIILAFNAFWEMKFVTMVVIWDFVSELNMDSFISNLSSSTDTEFQMTTICSNFFSQSAVKAWIIANCIDFVIQVFELIIFVYNIEGFQSESCGKS